VELLAERRTRTSPSSYPSRPSRVEKPPADQVHPSRGPADSECATSQRRGGGRNEAKWNGTGRRRRAKWGPATVVRCQGPLGGMVPAWPAIQHRLGRVGLSVVVVRAEVAWTDVDRAWR
jgi:hypothetical protein